MVVIGGVFFYWMLPRHAPAPRSRAIFPYRNNWMLPRHFPLQENWMLPRHFFYEKIEILFHLHPI
jgi:hypothetical protein